MQKRFVSIALAVILAMVPMSAMAATSDEIQTEIDAMEEELSQAKDEADETLDSQEELQEEVNDINSEIDELNDKIEDLGNISIRDAISDVSLEIIHSLKNIFNRSADSENRYQTTREQIVENQDQLEQLQTELVAVAEEFNETTLAAADLETKQTDLAEQLDDLQEEYDAAFAEEEAARLEAERIAAEEEAARAAEEEEAARIAEEEGEKAELEEEATHVDGDGTAAQTEADASSDGNPPVEEATSDSYDMPSDPNALTYSKGLNYFNGHTETWYTKREWKGELGIPGMYIGKDGIIRDCDNYICVASDDYPRGTVIETSLGTGKVYDSGSGHGNIDIYTDWPIP